jgi:hypothetical protein
MDHDDGASAGRDRRLDGRGIDVHGRGIDVHEDRCPPGIVNCAGGSKKGERSRDYLVARFEIERPEGKQQRIGTAGTGNSMLRVGQPRDLGLQPSNFGTHDEGLALDHGHESREHVVLDLPILRHQIQQRYVHQRP